MQNKDNEENSMDVKASIESLLEGETPEISQEEAIKAYHENVPTKKNKKAASDDEDDDLDDEHLKRIKQELLASLERVNKLAKLLFEKDAKKLKDIKLKDKEEQSKDKENEKNIEQTEQKAQEHRERSREE